MTPLGAPRTIAVLRALQLGDLLCAVPALRALRAAAPGAHVTLIGLPWARALVGRFPAYLDDFLELPGFPGFPERAWDAAAFAAFLSEAQARRFDLVLQWHGSGGLSNLLAALLGARAVSGYFRRGEYCPDSARFLPWNDGEREAERYLRLLRELGARGAVGAALEFPVTAKDRAEAAAFGLAGGDYAIVHPGAQLASRRWLPERFAEVADALAARGVRIVLTGTAAEARLTRHVARAMRAPAVDLAGRTTLGAVAALIDGARLLVANDTGVVHLAAARRTPAVVVSCGGDLRRWAPADARLTRVLHAPVSCRPCAHAECPIGHPCARGVESAAVVAAALEALVDAPRASTAVAAETVCAG